MSSTTNPESLSPAVQTRGMPPLVGRRVRLGSNWIRFLDKLNEDRIQEAEASLRTMLNRDNLRGISFLDVGSGSGLFSLATMRLGAKPVRSFDFDLESVECTEELKRRYFAHVHHWRICPGDVLDQQFLHSLGRFSVVYSWGVLHHTGALWTALENVVQLVEDNGLLFIAIYNRQPLMTPLWTRIKWLYNTLPTVLQWMIVMAYLCVKEPYFIASDILDGKTPTSRNRGATRRGMSVYRDAVDWLGGYLFEAATPEEITRFYSDRGFHLLEMPTVGGRSGCNQYVFKNSHPCN